jgi:cell division control protein 6
MPVFKNEEKLSPEYVPERLLFREGELKLLFSYFSSVIYGERPFHPHEGVCDRGCGDR